MTTVDLAAKRQQLHRDGCCVIEQILTPEYLEQLQAACLDLTQRQSEEQRRQQRSTGSMISTNQHPFFADLISWQPAIEVIEALGQGDAISTSGYLISKPPHSPPLFWHQDAWYWRDPDAYTDTMHQIFLMYYLVDTSPANGCLRVIPGSHRKRHALHDLKEAHTAELSEARDLSNPAFQDHPEARDICVKAGDLVIGDARLLHAAHANASDQERPVITLWYLPHFGSRSESFQANIAKHPHEIGLVDANREPWPAEAVAKIAPLRWQQYTGDADPLPWDRTPDARLS